MLKSSVTQSIVVYRLRVQRQTKSVLSIIVTSTRMHLKYYALLTCREVSLFSMQGTMAAFRTEPVVRARVGTETLIDRPLSSFLTRMAHNWHAPHLVTVKSPASPACLSSLCQMCQREWIMTPIFSRLETEVKWSTPSSIFGCLDLI